MDTATRVLSVRDVVTESEPKPEPEAEDDPAEAPEAGEGGGGSGVAEDAEQSEEPAAEEARDAEGAEDGEDAEDGEKPEPDAGTADDPEPEAKAKAKTAEPKVSEPKAPETGTPESEAPKADADTDPSEAEAEAETEAEPAVDRPTAVFKKPRPAVDQPTTMLKLGGAAKDAAKDGAKAAPKPGEGGEGKGGTKPAPKPAESEAERTSKFVALKPLDALDAPKPESAAPAGPKAEPTAPPARTTPAARPGFERTTQQPLPPKPPLDLLAELTNTPPPPETPLRTTMRRVKIWTPLVLLLLVVFAVVQALRPLPAPALALTAKDTYAFDGGKLSLPWPAEGQGWMDVQGVGAMGQFGAQKPVAIGSVAKTMTSYIILRDHPLKVGQEGPKIQIDPTAEKEGGYDKGGESTLNTVKAGQSLTEKQALSAVMIPSANNIARLLARWDAGSEAAFVKKMNDTAKELGMTHTTYTDPSGLKETTVSTAEDQVKLGNQVVQNPALVAITSAASWTDPSGKNWPNWNELPYRMGAIGIKTGSTTAAGGNLLFAARKKVGGETVTIVGAILGQHKGPSILGTANAVSKTALEAAKEALTSAKILKKGDVVGYVDDKLGGHTPVVVTEDVTAVGWAGSQVKLSFAADQVPHSAKAGTKVGTLTVGEGGAGGAIKVPVALSQDLGEPDFLAKLTRIS
ncbi:D-alanyl-D-alanine carboxypeptidase [Streptomyces sp. Tu 6176]|uniref:D-alanyl-D-alanine carboxypeptidase n=1 Tax=Streptomyces sp. Tu 6176 TaxID=1470557 RepID=UPI00099778D1|nr:D-alanyl-D-alanine carboxypeptidase [Streptomyces sp. Tu 6176]